MPLASKILAVADTYDAMTSNRPYRRGINKLQALEILNEVRGTQLDSDIVNVFTNIIKEDKNGQLDYYKGTIKKNFYAV